MDFALKSSAIIKMQKQTTKPFTNRQNVQVFKGDAIGKTESPTETGFKRTKKKKTEVKRNLNDLWLEVAKTLQIMHT